MQDNKSRASGEEYCKNFGNLDSSSINGFWLIYYNYSISSLS